MRKNFRFFALSEKLIKHVTVHFCIGNLIFPINNKFFEAAEKTVHRIVNNYKGTAFSSQFVKGTMFVD